LQNSKKGIQLEILKQPNGKGKVETKEIVKLMQPEKKKNRRIWQTKLLIIKNPQTQTRGHTKVLGLVGITTFHVPSIVVPKKLLKNQSKEESMVEQSMQ
jgi:hypothetical protein